MKSWRVPKKISPKRKFFLPVILIFFLLSFLVIGWLRQTELNFNLFGEEEIASSLPEKSRETVFQETLANYGLVAKKLTINGQELTAEISQTLVLFKIEEDFKPQVASLQFILSRAKIEGKLPKVVDLRFTKPVVSY